MTSLEADLAAEREKAATAQEKAAEAAASEREAALSKTSAELESVKRELAGRDAELEKAKDFRVKAYEDDLAAKARELEAARKDAGAGGCGGEE